MLRKFALVLMLGLSPLLIVGCAPESNTAESAADSAAEAAEDAGDAVDEAADEAADAVDEAADATEGN